MGKGSKGKKSGKKKIVKKKRQSALSSIELVDDGVDDVAESVEIAAEVIKTEKKPKEKKKSKKIDNSPIETLKPEKKAAEKPKGKPKLGTKENPRPITYGYTELEDLPLGWSVLFRVDYKENVGVKEWERWSVSPSKTAAERERKAGYKMSMEQLKRDEERIYYTNNPTTQEFQLTQLKVTKGLTDKKIEEFAEEAKKHRARLKENKQVPKFKFVLDPKKEPQFRIVRVLVNIQESVVK